MLDAIAVRFLFGPMRGQVHAMRAIDARTMLADGRAELPDADPSALAADDARVPAASASAVADRSDRVEPAARGRSRR